MSPFVGFVSGTTKLLLLESIATTKKILDLKSLVSPLITGLS
jgi:hypothetical protein